jgi:hypothetical protein
MKKIFLLAFTAVTLASCSDDDTTPAENEMTLQRTEKFTPSQQAYTSGSANSFKRVQYYENNRVVADTTYDTQGAVYGYVSHTYTSNTYTRHNYGNNQAERATKYTFDTQGRVTHAVDILQFPSAENVPPSYVYNTDGSVSQYFVDIEGGTSTLTQTYYTNNGGVITNSVYNPSGDTVDYSYTGNNISSYTYNDGYNAPNIINYTYYTTPVPSNMQRSAIEINNGFFMYDANPTDMTNELAYYGNGYLQSYQGYLTFDKTFNTLGYITYDKVTGSMFELLHDAETFYYYN